MRRRNVLALTLATALIFVLAGLGIGYAVWHTGTSNAAIVTNRTTDKISEGSFRFCLNYRVAGDSQTQCWNVDVSGNQLKPPDCWTNSKIGDPLPDICR